MPEKTLEELKKLSEPALRHVELVEIARIETPSKADDKASIRWPRRQAKATRFLAMLLRDYGSEAFEAYLLEHARPHGSEHAQGVGVMRFESVYPEGVRDVLFTGPRRMNRGTEPMELEIGHVMSDGRLKEFKLKDEIARFGLDEAQTKQLVRRVIDGMLAQWANPKDGHGQHDMWEHALEAARVYFPTDNELYKKLLLATVVYQGGKESAPIALVWAVLPSMPQGTSLQTVIDHMLERGCSKAEVIDAWNEMLKRQFQHGFKTWIIFDFWHGLQICGGRMGGSVEVNRQCVLRELKAYVESNVQDAIKPDPDRFDRLTLTEQDSLMMVEIVCQFTDREWRKNPSTVEVVEDMFITCLANGKVARAFHMLVQFGTYFGLGDRNAGDADPKKMVATLERLMRGALVKATENKSFGVACALAEHLGETAQADELRERARHMNQRVALDFGFCVFVDSRKFSS